MQFMVTIKPSSTHVNEVLATLICRLGPWRDFIFLVGGITPRYLIKSRPPAVPAHAGTSDVDVLVDVNLLERYAGVSNA